MHANGCSAAAALLTSAALEATSRAF